MLFLFSSILTIIRGASITVWWDWFVSGDTGAFHGELPGLSLFQALGLAVVVTAFTSDFIPDMDDDDAAINALAYGGLQIFILWIAAIVYYMFLV